MLRKNTYRKLLQSVIDTIDSEEYEDWRMRFYYSFPEGLAQFVFTKRKGRIEKYKTLVIDYPGGFKLYPKRENKR